MIKLKTVNELRLLRAAGRISQKALRLAGGAVEPGVTTKEIDEIVRQSARNKLKGILEATP